MSNVPNKTSCSPSSATLTIPAKPYPFSFQPCRTALLIIDMQRDFLLAGGFGEIQGGSLADVQACIEPTRRLLEASRAAGLAIFHTREGHKPDLSDCPSSKLVRQAAAPHSPNPRSEKQHKLVIGDRGEMGRLLVRGEYGHDIVDELKPLPNEVVIDKPGKGAFWDTDLMHRLKAHGITHILVAGVTTECCVATTFREANDRGFECCAVTEATAGYNPSFKTSSLDMLHWSQGLFGFVSDLQPLLECLGPLSVSPNPSLGDGQTPPQTPPEWDGDVSISGLMAAYRSGLSPATVIESLYSRIEAYEQVNPGSWILRLSKEDILSAARDLATKHPDRGKLPPLFGIPFTVKDSIDVAGLPTTTACAPLSRIPAESAPVYTSVVECGALFLGKSNLDQLATGLSGQRSPYGACSSVCHRDFISGGSSSGSAVQVGAKLCSFSLATDTAGSGRVPAMFNGVVGYKPTRGTVPFVGITPACLSLDCVAVIASSVGDARLVWQNIEGYDERDPYAKPRMGMLLRCVDAIGPQANQFTFGIPPPEVLAGVCSAPYRRLFADTVARLQRMGGTLKPVDWEPFKKAGDLLYDGSFVLERMASLPDLVASSSSSSSSSINASEGLGATTLAKTWLRAKEKELHPVITTLFTAALERPTTPADVFRDLQKQALYTAQVRNHIFTREEGGVDVMVVPTAPTHFTTREMQEEPIARNSVLGTFTHAGNVLDLCGIAVPAGRFDAVELERQEGELPFGVTFLGGSGLDAEVLGIASRFEEEAARDGLTE
ncbi:amidase signature enzyme [Zalerion maritima]|uniref:Amidase signature enzyme n=1 Tax=Zalerion maritima TaxID=339359 RepID=A0AAD5WPN7_9PEZI|nr:amidase signature enzyme [Zalerion maritima]